MGVLAESSGVAVVGSEVVAVTPFFGLPPLRLTAGGVVVEDSVDSEAAETVGAPSAGGVVVEDSVDWGAALLLDFLVRLGAGEVASSEGVVEGFSVSSPVAGVALAFFALDFLGLSCSEGSSPPSEEISSPSSAEASSPPPLEGFKIIDLDLDFRPRLVRGGGIFSGISSEIGSFGRRSSGSTSHMIGSKGAAVWEKSPSGVPIPVCARAMRFPGGIVEYIRIVVYFQAKGAMLKNLRLEWNSREDVFVVGGIETIVVVEDEGEVRGFDGEAGMSVSPEEVATNFLGILCLDEVFAVSMVVKLSFPGFPLPLGSALLGIAVASGVAVSAIAAEPLLSLTFLVCLGACSGVLVGGASSVASFSWD